MDCSKLPISVRRGSSTYSNLVPYYKGIQCTRLKALWATVLLVLLCAVSAVVYTQFELLLLVPILLVLLTKVDTLVIKKHDYLQLFH